MKKKALVLLVGLLAASAVFAGCGVSQTTKLQQMEQHRQNSKKKRKI